MKTKIYLVSTLLFVLGITLKAQTSNSAIQKETNEASAQSSAENKRILTRLGGKTVPDNMSAENPLAVKTANISGESERNDLLKLAEALNYQSQRLRRDAETKNGNEKAQMLAEANKFEHNSLQKQIAASEIFGTINQVKFNSNKETINKLIVSPDVDDVKKSRSRTLISSSEINMQKAKDLRQESYNLTNLRGRLGIMSNAEEKEMTALHEQGEVINLLFKKAKSGI